MNDKVAKSQFFPFRAQRWTEAKGRKGMGMARKNEELAKNWPAGLQRAQFHILLLDWAVGRENPHNNLERGEEKEKERKERIGKEGKNWVGREEQCWENVGLGGCRGQMRGRRRWKEKMDGMNWMLGWMDRTAEFAGNNVCSSTMNAKIGGAEIIFRWICAVYFRVEMANSN
jgi:hypothetical protein